MQALFNSIRQTFVNLWNIGNFWLRIPIYATILWLPTIALIALTTGPAATAFFAVAIPVLGIAVLFLSVLDPMVVVVIGAIERRAIRLMAALLGVQFLVGLALAFLPFEEDPGMLPILALLAATYICLKVANIMRGTRFLVGLGMVTVIAILVIGGRDKASALVDNAKEYAAKAMIATGRYPLCADQTPYQLGVTKEYEITSVDVPIYPECWSAWILTPNEGTYSFYTDGNEGVELMFLNGDRIYIGPDESEFWPKRRGIFRARGVGTLHVSIEVDVN